MTLWRLPAHVLTFAPRHGDQARARAVVAGIRHAIAPPMRRWRLREFARENWPLVLYVIAAAFLTAWSTLAAMQ